MVPRAYIHVSNHQEPDTISGILAQDVGGPVTEYDNACSSVLLHMVTPTNTVARLEQSTRDSTTSTDKYKNSPSALDRARSKSVLERIDKMPKGVHTVHNCSLPHSVVEALSHNMTTIVQKCYREAKVKINQKQKNKLEASIDLQWDLLRNQRRLFRR